MGKKQGVMFKLKSNDKSSENHLSNVKAIVTPQTSAVPCRGHKKGLGSLISD